MIQRATEYVDNITECKECKENNTNSSTIYDTNTGDVVCTNCGKVVTMDLFGTLHTDFDPPRSSCPYKRSNHFNQILLAWANPNRRSKSLPEDLLACVIPVALDYSKRTGRSFKSFRKSDISNIYRVTQIPAYLGKKYCSKRKQQVHLKNLLQRKQYILRWWGVRDKLIQRLEDPAYEPILPKSELVEILKDLFGRVLVPFTYIRHSAICGNSLKCHKLDGCRFAVLHVYFTIVQLMEVISPRLAKRWKDDFPQISVSKRKSLRYKYWIKMMEWLDWPTVLHRYLLDKYGIEQLTRIIQNK
jgi:hypothetical protein